MTETELKMAIQEGLYQLHTRMVEADEDAEEIAEIIMESAIELWPELSDTWMTYDRLEEDDWK